MVSAQGVVPRSPCPSSVQTHQRVGIQGQGISSPSAGWEFSGLPALAALVSFQYCPFPSQASPSGIAASSFMREPGTV